jgi:regulator of protease activity HflC (stomatin/prohibitin superfamily)
MFTTRLRAELRKLGRVALSIRHRPDLLIVAGLAGVLFLAYHFPPIALLEPDEIGVRTNRWTGTSETLDGPWIVAVPGIQRLDRISVAERIYHPTTAASASGEAPFQSVEGLSVGLDVTLRWALDRDRVRHATVRTIDLDPAIDGAIRRVIARHTVREIFSSGRAEIEDEVRQELARVLSTEGGVVRGVVLGKVDLPKEYRAGLEQLLTEELAAEKMRFTIEKKAKEVKEKELEAEADKVKREKAAEAAGEEEIIAAKARAEAMKHVLPFKEKEIEQRRLEGEAAKVARLKDAEAQAEARKIEAQGEADSRRVLADSDAYRAEVLGKVASEALARDAALVEKNPLVIQKTLADKLSDKISVIIAPPSASGGFIANSLIGGPAATPSPEKNDP